MPDTTLKRPRYIRRGVLLAGANWAGLALVVSRFPHPIEALEHMLSVVPVPDARPRQRGRPLELASEEVLRRIRAWSREGQLFRVHHDEPGFYARARRQFGSWANALAAAGVDHSRVVAEARRRSIEKRRRSRPSEAR